ncbi:CDP-diacylglycerol--inositol 3-phosphatidyltransferase SCDLUD_002341 [Saccharomycodes ludwigii]|uniref:CDP-diacylglycerol--inositol 3-phosphatidyltransferase n=1 Tax=Saccharomycodes ludwigii TaxID=36035 RepID=UPI001E8371D7|nr:hypothetical protein SCDLUD_002341 [Saccharomycodes ludwigii]KAH3900883.1 hypothetical protein SCDLUD_002341 [Saccharomycodes ludwigii]
MATVKNQRSLNVTASDIFKYIPNKIGYARIITMVLSLFFMKSCPLLTTLIYGISCLLDAVDGTMARKYNQCSGFGAVLDMIADRSTTACLIIYLSSVYPSYLMPFFQMANALDLCSHYMHMYATLSTGGGKSHKDIEKEQWLLNLYYSRRDVLFTICAFNELFYMALYWCSFVDRKCWYTLGIYTTIICLPGYIFKQIANVVQMNRAAVLLANKDAQNVNNNKK